MLGKFLFLDRDGTLIVEKHYLSDPAGVELIPGASKALGRLRAEGWQIAVITNQAGIGRGYYGVPEMEAVNRRVEELLTNDGARVDAFFFCPHHPDEGCDCRKPGTGMIDQARALFSIDPTASVVVGDRLSDLEVGRRIGGKAVLVRTGYGVAEEPAAGDVADEVIDSIKDLPEAVARLFGK